MGKLLIIIGILLVVVGVYLHYGGKLPLGRLPGDIIIRRDNFTFYFPITTGILLSLLLTLIFYLANRWR